MSTPGSPKLMRPSSSPSRRRPCIRATSSRRSRWPPIDPLGNLTVYTSTQAQFYCRSKDADTLGFPQHRVKVQAMQVGGGFGGKFVLLEPLVALLAVAIAATGRSCNTRAWKTSSPAIPRRSARSR